MKTLRLKNCLTELIRVFASWFYCGSFWVRDFIMHGITISFQQNTSDNN